MSGGSKMQAFWNKKHGIGYNGFIGVDFDGTLVTENNPCGKPIMPMIDKVREWIAEGREVVIFTAAPRPQITEFCKKWFGRALRQTNIKERGCNAWVDDRHILVERDTGRIISNDSDAIQLLKDDIYELQCEVRRLQALKTPTMFADDVPEQFIEESSVVRVLKDLVERDIDEFTANTDDVSEIATEKPELDAAIELLDSIGAYDDPRIKAPEIDSFDEYAASFGGPLDE